MTYPSPIVLFSNHTIVLLFPEKYSWRNTSYYNSCPLSRVLKNKTKLFLKPIEATWNPVSKNKRGQKQAGLGSAGSWSVKCLLGTGRTLSLIPNTTKIKRKPNTKLLGTFLVFGHIIISPPGRLFIHLWRIPSRSSQNVPSTIFSIFLWNNLFLKVPRV